MSASFDRDYEELLIKLDNFDSLKERIKELENENNNLYQSLKECQKVLSYYGNSNLPCDCSSNIHYDNQTALNLLTKINEVLK